MKRYEFAIKAIQQEMLRSIGKVAMKCVDKGWPVRLSTENAKVKNLKRAIKILEEHPENTHV